MVRKAQIEIKKNCAVERRGEFHHILTQEELNGHGSYVRDGPPETGLQHRISSAHREHRAIFYFGRKRYVCR